MRAEHEPTQVWLAAQLGFSESSGHVSALPTDLDWQLVLSLAEREGLAGFLHERWSRAAGEQIPPAVRQRLQTAHTRTLMSNALHLNELEYWLGVLDSAEVPVLVLKGAALGTLLYDRQGWRRLTDLDLLVPRDAMPRVIQMLGTDGYEPFRELDPGTRMPIRTQVLYSRRKPFPAAVDLHWHLIDSAYFVQRVPVAWFWEHRRSVQVGSRAIQTLDAEAYLLYLSSHLAFHHAGRGLSRFYDIAALLHRFSRQLDWDLVLSKAEEFQWGHSLRSAVLGAVRLFRVPLPPEVREHLEHLPSTFHERLAFALAGDRAHPAAFVFDGWYQTSWRGRWQYWRESLVPSAEFMRERHGAGDAAGLTIEYLARMWRGLVRVPPAVLTAVLASRNGRSGITEESAWNKRA